MSVSTYTERERSLADKANEIINSAVSCIDRGELDGLKLGKCHVFRESDVCMCGEVDLAKERMR